jgi:hypothetical protein
MNGVSDLLAGVPTSTKSSHGSLFQLFALPQCVLTLRSGLNYPLDHDDFLSAFTNRQSALILGGPTADYMTKTKGRPKADFVGDIPFDTSFWWNLRKIWLSDHPPDRYLARFL